jgi:hypothetical protein
VARSIEDYTDIRQFSDAELTAIMRGRLEAVSVESDEERPSAGEFVRGGIAPRIKRCAKDGLGDVPQQSDATLRREPH